MPIGGLMVIAPVAGTTDLPDAQFVFTQSGYLTIQIGTKVANKKRTVASQRIVTGEVPQVGDDISLTIKDDGYIELYNKGSQSIISTGCTWNDGLDNQDFSGRLEFDRRFRVRNGANDVVWTFPSTRQNLTFLDSSSLNYMGEGDLLRSSNNMWWITFNKNGLLRTNNNFALNKASNVPFDPRVLSISKYGAIESFTADGEGRGTIISRKQASELPGTFIIQIEDDGKIVVIDQVSGTSSLVFDIATVGYAGPPSGSDPALPWPPVVTLPPVLPTSTTTSLSQSTACLQHKALWSDTNPVLVKDQFIVSPSGSFKFGIGSDGYVQIVKDGVVLRRYSPNIIDQSTVASQTFFTLTLSHTCRLTFASSAFGKSIQGLIFDDITPVNIPAPFPHKVLAINDDGIVTCSDKVTGQRYEETGYKVFKLRTSTPLNYMNVRARSRPHLQWPHPSHHFFNEAVSRMVLGKDGSVNVYNPAGKSIWSPAIELNAATSHILEVSDDCQATSSWVDKTVSHVVVADESLPNGLIYSPIYQIVKNTCLALKKGNTRNAPISTEPWAFDSQGKLHPESNPELWRRQHLRQPYWSPACTTNGLVFVRNANDESIRLPDGRPLDDYLTVGSNVVIFALNYVDNSNQRWSTNINSVVPTNLNYLKYKTAFSNKFMRVDSVSTEAKSSLTLKSMTIASTLGLMLWGDGRLFMQACSTDVKKWTITNGMIQTQPLGCVNWERGLNDGGYLQMWDCNKSNALTWDNFA
ncbi:hypothetical protein BC829DRAFT_444006 [Chytridium lagenaria]|nr:hypothetical protein BC829DRAFT_444006 [Chytridium lagenaria]